MALTPCPECQKDVSDKALICVHCGMPFPPKAPPARGSSIPLVIASLVLVGVAALGVARGVGRPGYDQVDELREEQDARGGTHNEHVRQRSYRLYREHPNDAMYAYLWARCIDDPEKQLGVAEEGIRADPRFAWNYNVGAHALSRLNKVAQAYDMAVKGSGLDPANMQLADKRDVLKIVVDRKLGDQARPAPNAEKGAVHYRGLFHGHIRTPGRADLRAVASRIPDHKGPVAEVARGFSVCANPVGDACLRAYVPVDGRLGSTWPASPVNVGAFKDRQVLALAGSVVLNEDGDEIMIADAVTVEP